MDCRMVAAAVLGAMAAGLTAPGCGPDVKALTAEALSARVNPVADYNASARFTREHYLAKPEHRDYVLWAMEYASLCLMGGNYDAAREELLRCYQDIEQATGGETRAALGAEAAKRFKGEPFERATLCVYLGLLHYIDGDYNNARIFFTQATFQDATTGEDMAQYRDDFRLTHYWLGRTYQKLDQHDNARIAFAKTAQRVPRKGEDKELSRIQKAQAAELKRRLRAEQAGYKAWSNPNRGLAGVADLADSPTIDRMPAVLDGASAGQSPVLSAAASLEQFLAPDFQRQANLVVVIETGRGPIRTLYGKHDQHDRIDRAEYPVRQAMVYVDGHKAGPAFQLLDTFHQADTRGKGSMDTVRSAKGVTKSILQQVVGGVAGVWSIKADDRYWRLIPGEVHLFAGRVRPGLHTLTVECFDANGHLLPRYRLTRYLVPVRDDGSESVLLVHVQPEVDNALLSYQR